MRAVISNVPEDILAWRKRTGADRYDEMWESVLHMAPVPNREHQDFAFHLEAWLRGNWGARTGGKVYHEINVARRGAWPKDYRVPDLVLLTPERASIDKNAYFDGGPDVVVEIRSPDDESMEKLPFYADVGVREAWVIDRDARVPTVYELAPGRAPVARACGDDGFVKSEATGIELGVTDAQLVIRLVGESDTEARIP